MANYFVTEYQTVKIYTDGEVFTTSMERYSEEGVSAPTLHDLRKLIDNLFAEEKKNGHKDALLVRYGDEFERVKVTSIDGKEAWIKKNNGQRQKIELKYLLEATDENIERFEKSHSLRKQARKLMDEASLFKYLPELNTTKKEEGHE